MFMNVHILNVLCSYKPFSIDVPDVTIGICKSAVL